jgi:hypothetical protein
VGAWKQAETTAEQQHLERQNHCQARPSGSFNEAQAVEAIILDFSLCLGNPRQLAFQMREEVSLGLAHPV